MEKEGSNKPENMEALQQRLDRAREELHKVNIEKMERRDESKPDSTVEGRTYSLKEGREAAEKALDNCQDISSIVRMVDGRIANELDSNIRTARDRLDQAGNSPEAMDDWYRNELVPLLNKSEQASDLSTIGAEEKKK